MTVPGDDQTTKKRWLHLRRILERSGPFKDPNFMPSPEVDCQLYELHNDLKSFDF